MDQVDAVEHLGATRAGTCLRNAEELLVLWRLSYPGTDSMGIGIAYHLLIYPPQFVYEFVVELGYSVSHRAMFNLESDARMLRCVTTFSGTYDLEVNRGPTEGGEAHVPALAGGVLELEEKLGRMKAVPIGICADAHGGSWGPWALR